jgi:transposase
MQRSFGTEISGNRRPGAELSDVQRAGILSAVEAEEEKIKIAARYRVTRRVIYNTIDRWNNHHTLKSLPRPGRPEKLTRRQKRLLLRIVRRNPRIDYAALKCQAVGVTVEHRTLQRLFKKHHITKWLAKKRPKLTPAVARLRYLWAQKYKGFPWRRVKFSNKCSYERGSGKKPVWVFRTSLQK